jgi:hypothetical protein
VATKIANLKGLNFPAHMISCLTELPLYCLIIYIDGRILWCTHFFLCTYFCNDIYTGSHSWNIAKVGIKHQSINQYKNDTEFHLLDVIVSSKKKIQHIPNIKTVWIHNMK